MKSTTLNSGDVNMKCKLFQRDLWSSLLFCLSLILLNKLPKEINCRYKVSGKIANHLLYADDLKCFAKNDNQLQMKFWHDNCAKATFLKEKLSSSRNVTLDRNIERNELEDERSYNNWCHLEGKGIKNSFVREKYEGGILQNKCDYENSVKWQKQNWSCKHIRHIDIHLQLQYYELVRLWD